MESPSADETDSEKVVQNTATRNPESRIRRKRWERLLPRKYIISSDSSKSLELETEIETTDTGIRRRTKGLLDSGADGLFMDKGYVQTNDITTRSLSEPIPVYNPQRGQSDYGSCGRHTPV